MNILKQNKEKNQWYFRNFSINKIPETDAIFKNINETKKFVPLSGNEVAIISLDDKNRKKIGNIINNGYS